MLSTKEPDASPGVELHDETPHLPPTQDRSQAISSNKRFLVALSFPGERRNFVSQVAYCLEIEIGRERTLYDRFFEAEFARPNLDTYLQNLYHNESELVVVFLGRDYERKEWPGLEWRAVRDLLKKRKDSSIMPIRLDDGDVTGSFSIDGYVDAAGRGPDEIAGLILDRLHILTVGRSPHRAPPVAPQAAGLFASIHVRTKKMSLRIVLASCLVFALVTGGALALRQMLHKSAITLPPEKTAQDGGASKPDKPATPARPAAAGGGESSSLVLDGGDLPPGVVGTAYSYRLEEPANARIRSPLHWSTSGRFIPGLRLDPRSGAITGVPRAAGDYRFSVRMKDGKGHTTSAEFNIAIRQPLAVVIENSPLEGTVGVPYAQNFMATGGTGKYSFSLDRVVPGLHFDGAAGRLEGIPGAAGRFTLSVSAVDSAGSSASAPVDVTIRPPVAIAPLAALPDAMAGRRILDVTFTASGGEGHYRWSSRSNLPPGLHLGAEGKLSGTPAAPGTYNFLIQVEDAHGRTASVPLLLMVRGVPTRLLTSAFQARLGQLFSEELQVADAPAPNITVSGLPRFLSYDTANHRLQGTPTAFGTYKILVKAMGPSIASAEFEVRVDVPLRIFVEKPFGLEPELSLFRLIADSCLSQQPYAVVSRRDEADAVLSCPQCSAANGRIPIQLNATFDLPARARSALPGRSLWTYSFIKAGLTDDMKSTEACTGELGLQNSVESINRKLKGER